MNLLILLLKLPRYLDNLTQLVFEHSELGLRLIVLLFIVKGVLTEPLRMMHVTRFTLGIGSTSCTCLWTPKAVHIAIHR